MTKETKHTPAIQALNDFNLSNTGKTFTLGGGKYTRQVWLDQHIPTIIQTLENHDGLLEALEASKAVLVSILGETYEHEIINEQVDIIEKAIAKARGES